MLFIKLLFKEMYHFFAKKNGREFLRLSFWYGKKPRYKAIKVKTLGYKLDIPDALSWLWQFEEIFFQEFYKFSTANPTPLIIDCGANVGMSCLYFKNIYPNAIIKAFEADENIALLLTKNLQNNLTQTQLKDIEIHPKAVWIHNEGVFFVGDGADGGTIKATENTTKKTPSVRLKDILLAQKNTVDMLKIDIEGAETQVLEDCKDALGNVSHIFIEYHAFVTETQSLHTILKILEENNFRYFIKNSLDRRSPFINQTPKNGGQMDMQLNIFAYKN